MAVPLARSPVPDRIPGSQAGFLDDVGRTLQAWRRHPLLPVAILVVAAVALLGSAPSPGLSGLGGLLTLLLLGWSGAERLWYLRIWTGRSMTPGEAWRATLRCFGRFFVLGLVVVLVFAVLAIPLLVAVFREVDLASGTSPAPGDLPAWVLVYSALLTLAGNALLTFVSPALVYSSKRVRDALPIGLRLLRVSWPRTAAYVLVPPVLAGVPGLVVGLAPLSPVTALTMLLSALVLSLGRGAVAAFYVRTVPGAGPDGAVQLAPPQGYYPPPDW